MIGALIGAGAGLLTSTLGSISSNSTLDRQIAYQEDAQRLQNEANLQITREYNKAQQELAKSQNEYNTMMWEKQNEYNSPKATMERLVEAGINPRAYQQIGQFANAGTPAPAVTPEQKMQEYIEPKIASTQLRMQKLAIKNAYTEQKIRAVELGSDLFQKYKELEEKKRHNKVIEEFGDQKSQREYTMLEAKLLKDFGIRITNFAQNSINPYNTISIDIPQWVYDLSEREKVAYVEKLEKSLNLTDEQMTKLKTETEYLELKKTLETVKTGNAVLDNIVKLLIRIF